MSDSLSYHHLDAMVNGDAVVDRHGMEWRKGTGDWWRRTDDAHDDLTTDRLMMHRGPITIGVNEKVRVKGWDPSYGGPRESSSPVTLFLMSDGTVRWDKDV